MIFYKRHKEKELYYKCEICGKLTESPGEICIDCVHKKQINFFNNLPDNAMCFRCHDPITKDTFSATDLQIAILMEAGVYRCDKCMEMKPGAVKMAYRRKIENDHLAELEVFHRTGML